MTKPRALGTVSSINATLQLFIADASVARGYRGIDGAEDDELEGTDFQRLTAALGEETALMLEVGDGAGIALDLGIGQGTARLFWSPAGLLVIEAFVDDEDDDDAWLELAELPLDAAAERVGELQVTSGCVVMTPSTDSCAEAPAFLAVNEAAACGSEESSLAIGVEPGRYTLFVEAPREDYRRARLVSS
jgi:hypothetical protein